jgi:hypothetical protein
VAVLKEKSQKVMPFLFPVMEQRGILTNLFMRVDPSYFESSAGDKALIKLGKLRAVARKYTWRSRVAPIVTIEVRFGTHTYSATELTDEHFTMDDVKFATEVAIPQMEAVVDDLEMDIRQSFNALRTKVTLTFNTGDDPYDFAVDAQAELDGFRVAPNDSQRVWIVGSNVAKDILKSDRITRFDSAGASNEMALRRAEIGELAGLRVVKDLEVDPNFSFVTHKTGLLVATKAPDVPPTGAVSGAKTSKDGTELRHIIDYDSNYLVARSVVSTFSGVTPVYDERVGGHGADRYDLKQYGEGVQPVSVRSLRVNYNGTNADAY